MIEEGNSYLESLDNEALMSPGEDEEWTSVMIQELQSKNEDIERELKRTKLQMSKLS